MSESAQAGYAHGLHAVLNQLVSIVESDPSLREAREPPRDRAIALYTQMIGALVLSRAVLSADRPLANEILCAARRHLLRAVGDETEVVPSVDDKRRRTRRSHH